MNDATPARSSLDRRVLRPLLLSLVLVLMLASASHVSAQAEHRLAIDQVIVSEDGRSVTALISVLDPAGQPVPGLTTFDTAIDGLPVTVESVQPVISEETGIAVLLLIDVSGSMAGEPLTQAQAAASTFVAGLLSRDIAALDTFAASPPDGAVFTLDRDALLARISQLQTESESGTALYDTVVTGLAIAAEAPTARRAVVLLTDGQDSGGVSERSRADALDAAAEAGLPIYAIGLGPGADSAFLEALAQQAGGNFYLAPTPADVPTIFNAIGATLRSQYALTFALPSAAQVERNLSVVVELVGTTLTAQAPFSAPSSVIGTGADDDGLPVWVWLALIVAVALVAAAYGIWFARRWRRRTSALPGGPGHDTPLPTPAAEHPEPVAAATGRLSVIEGPNAGASVRLTSDPIDLGANSDCGLQLDAADGLVAGIHARTWLQGERLMLHHLAPGHRTLVGGKPIEWATLQTEDTLQIGPHIISFALDR